MTYSTPKLAALTLLTFTAPAVLAQGDSANRIINIQGAPRGDIRNGPMTCLLYTSPSPRD